MNFEKNILEKKEDHRLKIEHSDTFDLILNSESFNIDNYDVDDETFYFILLCHDLEGDEDFVFDFLRKHKNSNIDFDAIKKDIINLNSELKEKEEIDYEKRRRDEEKRKECSNFFSEEINLMEGFLSPKKIKKLFGYLSLIKKESMKRVALDVTWETNILSFLHVKIWIMQNMNFCIVLLIQLWKK